MKKALRRLAIVVAVLGAVTNLPGLVTGFSFLREWIRLYTSHGPYFRWSYLPIGMACVLIWGCGVALANHAIWRQRLCLLLAGVSLVFGFAGMLELPEVGPQLDKAEAMQRLLGHADHSLADWDEAQGRFPANEQELRQALAPRPLHEPPVFFLRGEPIPYDVRVITDARGPEVETVPPNPGTIIYAVTSDYKRYWLTITTLRDPVGGPVVLEHTAGQYEHEPVWVMTRKHRVPGEGYWPTIE